MNCPRCNKPIAKNGKTAEGVQKYRCVHCGHSPEGLEKKDPVIEVKENIGMGISEAQLRSKHDLKFIVKNKCDELRHGVFMTQSEFIQFCKINPGAGYRGVIEHPEYERFHGRASGTIYWSHPESIKKLKDEGVLI